MGLIKSKLKRRLRKKYHLGEFSEYGFEISIGFEPDLPEDSVSKLYDACIREIENLGLLFGGGGNSPEYSGFITSAKKHRSASAGQKDKLNDWLKNRSGIKKFMLSEFQDAWR